MTWAELVEHLVTNRYLLGDGPIVDCLALARFLQRHGADQRHQWPEVAAALGTTSQAYLGQRLKRLKRLGLVAYRKGTKGATGYLFTRLGPE